ncbi:hypothetical protein BpHYR1_008925 [Brachionus plicatilis]|uniref:Uncharacterized protein n=1 Tax=Brachionus plicatilis TaxID=10195 RepID=A0A3M7RL16_BRAPC|nr:hypothetical protein BpHYR1_008925 [Brachionus plicatilis]
MEFKYFTLCVLKINANITTLIKTKFSFEFGMITFLIEIKNKQNQNRKINAENRVTKMKKSPKNFKKVRKCQNAQKK